MHISQKQYSHQEHWNSIPGQSMKGFVVDKVAKVFLLVLHFPQWHHFTNTSTLKFHLPQTPHNWHLFHTDRLICAYKGCPTRYRTRHFFNNSNTNEDIATKFEQEFVRCVRNEEECVCSVCLFRSNILISCKIIKGMLVSVASGTHYITNTTLLALCYSSMFQPSKGHPQGAQLIRFHSKINKIYTTS